MRVAPQTRYLPWPLEDQPHATPAACEKAEPIRSGTAFFYPGLASQRERRRTERLTQRLSAHRTAALQIEVARHPQVALAALVHGMVQATLHRQKAAMLTPITREVDGSWRQAVQA